MWILNLEKYEDGLCNFLRNLKIVVLTFDLGFSYKFDTTYKRENGLEKNLTRGRENEEARYCAVNVV